MRAAGINIDYDIDEMSKEELIILEHKMTEKLVSKYNLHIEGDFLKLKNGFSPSSRLCSISTILFFISILISYLLGDSLVSYIPAMIILTLGFVIYWNRGVFERAVQKVESEEKGGDYFFTELGLIRVKIGKTDFKKY